MDVNGLVTIKSNHNLKDTLDGVLSGIDHAGFHVFAKIDHSGKASERGLNLLPTILVLFGNPQVGSGLMMDRQTTGIDLPSKILIWEDEHGGVWLSYNDTNWLAQRHGLSSDAEKTIRKIDTTIKEIVESAAGY